MAKLSEQAERYDEMVNFMFVPLACSNAYCALTSTGTYYRKDVAKVRRGLGG